MIRRKNLILDFLSDSVSLPIERICDIRFIMLKTTVSFMVLLLAGLGVSKAAQHLSACDGWSFDSSTMRLEIADASTWVSIAKVKLKITELELQEGRLTGSYDLRVPIRTSKNEAGVIDLTFPQQIADMRVSGGKMIGTGVRHDGAEEPRDVVCEIIPDESNLDRGKIILKIDTGERVLTFNSTYAVRYDGDQSDHQG